MGLKLRKTLPNGVQVNYHRITRIEHVLGAETAIFVASYTSQAKRKELFEEESADVYMSESVYELPCDTSLDIAKAYAYLKTLDFESASDVMEGD